MIFVIQLFFSLSLSLSLLPILIKKTSLRISNDFHLLLLSRSVVVFLGKKKKMSFFSIFLLYFPLRLQNQHQLHQNVYQVNVWCQTMMM